jgi:hypothetical protein
VLHTLIFEIENGQEDTEFVEELVQGGLDEGPAGATEDEVIVERRRETQGQRKREQLKGDLFEYLEQQEDIEDM